MTEDGHEIQFGTHHMGHALFTKLLTPTLLKTAEELKSDVRVINVSSEDHQLVSGLSIIYEQAKLEGYSTLRLCGQSKLANIMHRRELQTRYPSIMATSVYPGVIVTDPYTAVNASSVIRGITSLMSYVVLDVQVGRRTRFGLSRRQKRRSAPVSMGILLAIRSQAAFGMRRSRSSRKIFGNGLRRTLRKRATEEAVRSKVKRSLGLVTTEEIFRSCSGDL